MIHWKEQSEKRFDITKELGLYIRRMIMKCTLFLMEMFGIILVFSLFGCVGSNGSETGINKSQPETITSGRINTMNKFSFKYGRLDASIKVPKIANGMWPAFWLLGANFQTVGWPQCGEIDIMELGTAEGINKGLQERFLTRAAHWGKTVNGGHPVYAVSSQYATQTGSPSENSLIPELSNGFHLYTMIWDEQYIRMYLDLDKNPSAPPYYEMRIDADEGQYPVKDYFHKPFFIILNVAVGGNLPNIYDIERITALNETNNFEASMYVDYIKYTSDDGNSTWEDNFDGTALDLTRWNIEENDDGGGNNELQSYRAGNVSVGQEPETCKNCLILTARR